MSKTSYSRYSDSLHSPKYIKIRLVVSGAVPCTGEEEGPLKWGLMWMFLGWCCWCCWCWLGCACECRGGEFNKRGTCVSCCVLGPGEWWDRRGIISCSGCWGIGVPGSGNSPGPPLPLGPGRRDWWWWCWSGGVILSCCFKRKKERKKKRGETERPSINSISSFSFTLKNHYLVVLWPWLSRWPL